MFPIKIDLRDALMIEFISVNEGRPILMAELETATRLKKSMTSRRISELIMRGLISRDGKYYTVTELGYISKAYFDDAISANDHFQRLAVVTTAPNEYRYD